MRVWAVAAIESGVYIPRLWKGIPLPATPVSRSVAQPGSALVWGTRGSSVRIRPLRPFPPRKRQGIREPQGASFMIGQILPIVLFLVAIFVLNKIVTGRFG